MNNTEIKTTNKIAGNGYDFDNGCNFNYIKVGGVNFVPHKLLEKIKEGNCYLIRRQSISLLTYTENADVYTFKAKKLISGKSFGFTLQGRYFLMNEKYTEDFIKGIKGYENFDFEPFRIELEVA